MTRLRVQEQAKAHGLPTLSALQEAVIRGGRAIPLGTLRRYWYSTKNGLASGEPIKLVDITLLRIIAKVIGVSVGDLVNEDEPDQRIAA